MGLGDDPVPVRVQQVGDAHGGVCEVVTVDDGDTGLGELGHQLGGCLGVGSVLAEAADHVVPATGVALGRDGEVLHGVRVVGELGERRGLVQREVVAVGDRQGHVRSGDNESGLDVSELPAGGLRDLGGGHLEGGELLVALGLLGDRQVPALAVLDQHGRDLGDIVGQVGPHIAGHQLGARLDGGCESAVPGEDFLSVCGRDDHERLDHPYGADGLDHAGHVTEVVADVEGVCGQVGRATPDEDVSLGVGALVGGRCGGGCHWWFSFWLVTGGCRSGWCCLCAPVPDGSGCRDGDLWCGPVGLGRRSAQYSEGSRRVVA